MFNILKKEKNSEKEIDMETGTAGVKRLTGGNAFVKKLLMIIVVFCIAFIILCIKISIDNKDEESSVKTEQFISGQLEEIQELAVAKVIYEGVVEMEDDSGFFMKKFFVKYTGNVKAYVDLSKADIEVNSKKRTIKVKMPHAVIEEPNIDSDYQIYDKSWIKSGSLEATTEALARAEEDCKKKVDENTMIETADEYAEKAVENLLSSFTKLEKPYSCEIEWF